MRVPHWMSWLVLKHMSRLVRCRRGFRSSRERTKQRHQPKNRNNSSLTDDAAEVCLRLVNETHVIRQSPVAELRSAKQLGSRYATSNSNNLRQRELFTTDVGSPSASTVEMSAVDVKRLAVMEEILKYLKIMVAKQDDEDEVNSVVEEWREVAVVVDRFLFWVFLTITSVTTLVMIVFIPLFASY